MKKTRGAKIKSENPGEQAAIDMDLFMGAVHEFETLFFKVSGKVFNDKMPIRDAIDMDQASLDELYAQGFHLYNSGQYRDAIEIFQWLMMVDSNEVKYIFALAACFHSLKEYNKAISLYSLNSVLDKDNPIPHYHSADCFIQLADFSSAMLSLEIVLQRAGNKEQYRQLKERSVLVLNGLLKSKK